MGYLAEFWIEDMGCLYALRPTYDDAINEVRTTVESWVQRDKRKGEEDAAAAPKTGE